LWIGGSSITDGATAKYEAGNTWQQLVATIGAKVAAQTLDIAA
jgi:hypothetical protein